MHNLDLDSYHRHFHNDGLEQDCSNSSALPMDLPQSCTKPFIYTAAITESTYLPLGATIDAYMRW